MYTEIYKKEKKRGGQIRKPHIIWFDPVNNDPHFINLLSRILISEGIKVDVISNQRKGFSWSNKGKRNNFLPDFLTLHIGENRWWAKFFIAIFYMPCMMIAMLRLVIHRKLVLVSSALWFPFFDAMGLFFLKLFKIKFCILVHQPYKISFGFRFGTGAYFSPSYYYITLSKYSRNYLKNIYGIQGSHISVLPHPNYNSLYKGIDFLGESEYREIKNWKDNRTMFLYLSGTSESHGIIDLIEIIKECLNQKKPYCFFLCGKYSNKEEFKIAKEVITIFKGIEPVKCRFGYYSDKQGKIWLNLADALILPYREITQSGVIPLALGEGTPVIINNLEGLAERIKENLNGLIVRDRSKGAWLSAFEKISKGLIAEKSEIKKFEEQHYSAKSITKTVMRILSDL